MSDDILREEPGDPGVGEAGPASEADTAAQSPAPPAGEAAASAQAEGSDGAQSKEAEYLAGWQRALAELSNYKKRTERDRAQWQETITTDIVLELLPVLDDFDRAMESLPSGGDSTQQEWANGVLLIHRKLKTLLERLGLQEIEAVGAEFDPNLHEAVTHEDSNEHPTGHVIGVVRRGYRIGDRVVRPALVRVAS